SGTGVRRPLALKSQPRDGRMGISSSFPRGPIESSGFFFLPILMGGVGANHGATATSVARTAPSGRARDGARIMAASRGWWW
uniref:Uncharacterized protein n=1 Tax=Aegilops tauschii subsp. strangulata TaxID=200361 RepID=A0A453T329_AEGTS